MFRIDGTKISLTRGDTLRVQIFLKKDGVEYIPDQNDQIRFALKRPIMNSDRSAYKDRSPLILKSIPVSSMMLILSPEDTSSLCFGKYVYDIEMTFANGDVDTFIPNATFELLPEVH